MCGGGRVRLCVWCNFRNNHCELGTLLSGIAILYMLNGLMVY